MPLATLNARLRPPKDSYWVNAPREGWTAWIEQHRLPDMRVCAFANVVFFRPEDARPRSKARSYASEGME